MNPDDLQETPQQAIEKYTTDFTKLAADGKLDPVIGRDEEIRRSIQVLSRRTKNNPVLIGNPGVGKTAIVEGLANRIISGDVPENLLKKQLLSLDMGALMAGASFRGQFEGRLKAILKAVKESDGRYMPYIGYSPYHKAYAALDWDLSLQSVKFDGTVEYTYAWGFDASYLVRPAALTVDAQFVYNWRKRIFAGADCRFSTNRANALEDLWPVLFDLLHLAKMDEFFRYDDVLTALSHVMKYGASEDQLQEFIDTIYGAYWGNDSAALTQSINKMNKYSIDKNLIDDYSRGS